MNPFEYARAADARSAVAEVSGSPTAKFLGGGTNLIDLIKDDVEQPDKLIDITRLPAGFNQIAEIFPSTMLRIGAGVRNSDAAAHELVRSRYPALSEALLAGASPQLRNMATVGGNLLQRTRCYYFTDTAFPCNKRVPGSGCPAIGGYNRIHAVLGTSKSCIATHPSDMCVALAALDAIVNIQSPGGATRTVPIVDFHRLPGDTPQIETVLQHGELITSIDLFPSIVDAKSHYLKVRDRASYAFALVSVASALNIVDGKVAAARIALGGVAHKPWRAMEAETFLIGKEATEANFKKAADIALHGAKTYEHNKFKPELARRTIVRCLTMTKEMTS